MKEVELVGLERLLQEFVFEESVPCWEELWEALLTLGCSDSQVLRISIAAMRRL